MQASPTQREAQISPPAIHPLHRLVQIARDRRISCVTADILPDNFSMQHVCKKVGFQPHDKCDERVIKARIEL